jgi:hypothetical protein
MSDLKDEQWLVLDLLMRSRQKGVDKISRTELLHNTALPQGATIKLMWAALTMPADLITWHNGQTEFSITTTGAQIYNLRFGNGSNPQPTKVADSVICLPGPGHYRNG